MRQVAQNDVNLNYEHVELKSDRGTWIWSKFENKNRNFTTTLPN